jgi:2-methylcitrate dehydratase PrpD
MTSITHRLACHAIETPFAAIPQENLEAARLLTLDTLAVAWAGAEAPGCPEKAFYEVQNTLLRSKC